MRWGRGRAPLPRARRCSARVTLQARATSPDQGAVHGARRLGEDRAMMCGRESHGATAKETWGRLARGIPLIPLNPGESRFKINVSRNPVSVSGRDASRPGHSLTPSCPDSFRASTAPRRARPMEIAGYPDTRNESGQVRAGPGMTRELRARVGGRVDARNESGHDGAGRMSERSGRSDFARTSETGARATRESPPRCAPGRG